MFSFIGSSDNYISHDSYYAYKLLKGPDHAVQNSFLYIYILYSFLYKHVVFSILNDVVNICLLLHRSRVFLWVSNFTDGSVIVFVMGCYHNMEPGCHWRCLINGPWPQGVSQILSLTFAQQALNASCCEMKATLTSRYMAGSVFLRWSGFQWMTHTLFSIRKDPSNADGQMRCVEKMHDEVSVFDCLRHLLICVHVSVAMEPIQWKIQQEHVRISPVSEGPQYGHCRSFLVHVWLSLAGAAV